MKKKRPYKRKTTVRRTRTPMTVRRKSKRRKKSKFLEVMTRGLRLIIFFAVCAFIVYQLFKPEKKQESQPPASPQQQDRPVADSAEQVIIKPEPEVDIHTLPKAEALDYSIENIFDSYKIEKSWIKRNKNHIRVQLPPELPALTIIYDIIQTAKQLNLHYINSEEDLKNHKSEITLIHDNDTLLTITFSLNKLLKRKTGKIAIIIDDFGYYDNKTTNAFLEFDYPIMLSILPSQKFSKEIALKAKMYKKDIMLHLPMEPMEDRVEQTEFTIMTGMSDEEIVKRIKKALTVLPDAVAINNHMGSKATADERVMDIVFRELKAKDMMFVDSKTTLKSVASEMAKKYHLKFAQNAMFLERDKKENKDYIRLKLKAAAKIAEKKGQVVIIGHPYKVTISVLSEELPLLEKQGFVIVPITEIGE